VRTNYFNLDLNSEKKAKNTYKNIHDNDGRYDGPDGIYSSPSTSPTCT
jgi:hypothetical protein